MGPIRRLFARRHGLAAVLWLALLLPLAQAAALGHGYSHLGAGHADDRGALHATACELCLTAAAVTGGAAAVTVPALPPTAAVHGAPVHAPVADHDAAPALAYRSRAPPPLRA